MYEVLLSPHPSQHLLSVFFITATLVNVASHVVLICTFLITNDIDHLSFNICY